MLRTIVPKRTSVCPPPRPPSSDWRTLRTLVPVRPGQMCLQPVGRDPVTLQKLGFPLSRTIAQPRAWRGVLRAIEEERVHLLVGEVPSGRVINAIIRRSEVKSKLALVDKPVLVLVWKELKGGKWETRRKVLED